jgi:C-terminal processing protease CtpA/Prc
VLELAQKFSSQKNSIKHDIVFMLFSGEEAGLLGSNYFTKSDNFKQMNVVAMLNMDMIGRVNKNQLIIYGIGSSPVWETTIKNLNNNYNFDITYTQAGFGRSDHSSFYSNNVPAVHFFSGSHEDYHRPSDTYDKLDYSGQEKIVRLVYDVTSELDNEVTPPEFTKAEEESNENRTMGTVSIYVGTIPDYAFSGKGMKLSGVKEGGPAEKGGMKAGDIIVKFGEKSVENIYDFMYAMAEYKPDDEVDIIVLRDGKEVTLKITLEKR